MPFEIRNEGDCLFIVLSGVLTAPDLHRLVTEAQALEEAMSAVPNRITDMTSVVKFEFDSGAIAEIAERRRARTFPNSFKSGLIAGRPVALGLARMFQTLNDHPQIEIKIFGTVQEAKDWFAGKPAAARR